MQICKKEISPFFFLSKIEFLSDLSREILKSGLITFLRIPVHVFDLLFYLIEKGRSSSWYLDLYF